ncbi:MAG: hypothetical protein GYB19_10100 [Rhodospirillales bacterium]|nr:hypothetical protein [Rhodospirillales bacterium]
MRPTEVDERWKEWATPKQAEAIDAVLKHGTARAAAKALGIAQSNVSEKIKLARNKAARHGYAPENHMTRPVPDGFIAKGVSTYFDRDGNAAGQWVKSSIDQDRQRELLEQWVANLSAELPRVSPVPAPNPSFENLLNVHVITDVHLNMLVAQEDAGADWDIKIAEETVIKVFAAMLKNSPDAETGLVAYIGDFYHFDGVVNQTSRSQHPLTSAASYSEMIDVGQRMERRIINMALAKYKTVHVVRLPGNHDEATILATTPLFAAIYENEPRVTFDLTRLPHKVFQFGKTMLAFTHGDRIKLSDMPGLFASEFAEIWGSSKFRYGHRGHLHHDEEKYIHGMLCAQHSTLSARTEREAFHGYGGPRHAKTITYHREFGQCWNSTTSPEMVA